MVLADRAALWTEVYQGVNAANPGSFGGGEFLVYDFDEGVFEPSKIEINIK